MNPPPDQAAEKAAKTGERKDRFTTLGGIPLKTVYTQEAPGRARHREEAGPSGVPGEFPYTRGIYPTMYRGRLWTMRRCMPVLWHRRPIQQGTLPLPARKKGRPVCPVAFDLPTANRPRFQIQHRAMGEVGKTGVAIDSLEDMESLFQDIPLDRVTTSMTINATAAILLALYAARREKAGRGFAEKISRKPCRTTSWKGIHLARGTYIYPPRPSMRIVTDLFAWCRAELPAWNMISISGYHIREAGSTAAQEIAFSLADAIAYVDAAIAAGLGVDEFAPRLSFFFNAHNDLLEEIAKYRAARRLWAHLMRDRFGAKDPDFDEVAFSRADGPGSSSLPRSSRGE